MFESISGISVRNRKERRESHRNSKEKVRAKEGCFTKNSEEVLTGNHQASHGGIKTSASKTLPKIGEGGRYYE